MAIISHDEPGALKNLLPATHVQYAHTHTHTKHWKGADVTTQDGQQ